MHVTASGSQSEEAAVVCLHDRYNDEARVCPVFISASLFFESHLNSVSSVPGPSSDSFDSESPAVTTRTVRVSSAALARGSLFCDTPPCSPISQTSPRNTYDTTSKSAPTAPLWSIPTDRRVGPG